MLTLYVASTEAFAGKTSLSIGLAKHLQNDGYTVGYIKPLTTRVKPREGGTVAQDAEFLQAELGLDESLEDIAPIALTTDLIESEIQSPKGPQFYRDQLLATFQRVSAERDVVILEGVGHPLEGSLLQLSAPEVIALLDARVIAIVRCQDTLSIDIAAGLRTLFGERLIGLVLNAVPRRQMRFVQKIASAELEDKGLPVFAVLPEERLLSSISVSELIEELGGQCVCCQDHNDELVEYLMVGAMTAGSALTYFRRQPNKAVITGGDRHDLQLAALETSTHCLILTGGQQPSTVVLNRACEVGVPIVVVESDTLTAVRTLERAFGHTFMRQPRKSGHFANILEERFDFARFYDQLGLSPS